MAWPPGSRTAKRGGCSTDSLREAELLARGAASGLTCVARWAFWGGIADWGDLRG